MDTHSNSMPHDGVNDDTSDNIFKKKIPFIQKNDITLIDADRNI